MKDYSSWVLKDPSNLGVELIFDESEMSIQRDLKNHWLNILYCFIVLLSTFGNFLNYHEKDNNLSYVFAAVMIAMMTFMIYQVYLLWTEHIKNERVYQISEIQLIQIENRKNKARILIDFKDGSKDKMQVLKNNYFEIFIDTLKKNSIGIKENNKR
jgi:amino acid permease